MKKIEKENVSRPARMGAINMPETGIVGVVEVSTEGKAKIGAVDVVGMCTASVVGEVAVGIAVSAAISCSPGISVNEHAEQVKVASGSHTDTHKKGGGGGRRWQ